MIKKLILVIGLLFLCTLCIKFQFDKIQLTKQLNQSNETIENFKLTVSAYQDLIREITNRTRRECPEMFKGPKRPPSLQAPSGDSVTDDFSIPNRDIPGQEYKIDGAMPLI